MNIYFAGSIRGGRQDVDIYHQIIEELKTYGTVLTEFVGDKNIDDEDSTVVNKEREIHDKDMELLKQCQYVVAEVTQPSLGVGYEIGRAVEMKKTILCLYRPNSDRLLSAMILGAHNGDNFKVIEYSSFNEVPPILKDYFKP